MLSLKDRFDLLEADLISDLPAFMMARELPFAIFRYDPSHEEESEWVRSSAVSARGGDERGRGSPNGGGGFCSRCKEARETPRASQTATGPKSGTA